MDCQKIEVIMILGNFRSLLELLIFGTAWGPNAVVDVDSVYLFKSRSDNFWMSQDVKYNYTVNIAGIGDRSEYDIESFWKVVAVFQDDKDIEAPRSRRLST